MFVRTVAEAAFMACAPDYILLRPVLVELKRRYPVEPRTPTMTNESLHVAVVDIGKLTNLGWVVEGPSVNESGTDIDSCVGSGVLWLDAS